jgi:hypothetical protein
VVIGATLGNDAGVVVRLFGVECVAGEVMDGGSGKEVNCGGEGDGATVGSGSRVGMLSGRNVCCRKMLLSWSIW